jgi:hypothetical protein
MSSDHEAAAVPSSEGGSTETDALAFLYSRRQILAGDYLAGLRFRMLDEFKGDDRYRDRYVAAAGALAEVGDDARAMVELVAIERRMPRTQGGIEAMTVGLDRLNTHFKAADDHAAMIRTRLHA